MGIISGTVKIGETAVNDAEVALIEYNLQQVNFINDTTRSDYEKGENTSLEIAESGVTLKNTMEHFERHELVTTTSGTYAMLDCYVEAKKDIYLTSIEYYHNNLGDCTITVLDNALNVLRSPITKNGVGYMIFDIEPYLWNALQEIVIRLEPVGGQRRANSNYNGIMWKNNKTHYHGLGDYNYTFMLGFKHAPLTENGFRVGLPYNLTALNEDDDLILTWEDDIPTGIDFDTTVEYNITNETAHSDELLEEIFIVESEIENQHDTQSLSGGVYSYVGNDVRMNEDLTLTKIKIKAMESGLHTLYIRSGEGKTGTILYTATENIPSHGWYTFDIGYIKLLNLDVIHIGYDMPSAVNVYRTASGTVDLSFCTLNNMYYDDSNVYETLALSLVKADGTDGYKLAYYPVQEKSDLVVSVAGTPTIEYTQPDINDPRNIVFNLGHEPEASIVTASYTGVDDPIALNWNEATKNISLIGLPVLYENKHIWIRQTLDGDGLKTPLIQNIELYSNLKVPTVKDYKTHTKLGEYKFTNLDTNKKYHVIVQYENETDQYNSESYPYITPHTEV